MNADFNDLALHVAHRLWRHKPVAATYQGIHDYDDRFALFNCEYLNAFAEEADDLARRLRRFKDNELDADERYERDLLRGALEIAASEVRDMEYHTRSADIYIADIIQGLWVLTLRDNRPINERGEVVLGRLRGVWRVLREGTANLRAGRNVPKVWTEHGIQATEGALTFIENELEDFIDRVEDATLQAELREAVPPARKAIKHYLDFLRLDMLASSKGRYGVGKDHYQLLLTKRHGIKMTVAEMRSYAEECVSRARAALEEFALAEGDGRTWQELVRDVRRDVPEIDDLPTIYRQAFERARAFVADKGFVTVPDGDTIHYNWSPRHFRQFHPLIGVIAPAAFEKSPVSFAYATQMESTRQDEDRVVLMAPHCSASLAERASLNAFPGHLLRALHTSKVAGRLTRFHVAYPMVFGWAAYARQLMEEHGYFSTPEERLFYLRAELIDAVRCLMDVRMHTEEHTLDEATTMFQDLLDCESIVAEREARRFTITPCEGFAYMWGRDQIRALRAELSAKKGFDLKRFHDELLGCGTLPFALVRERMVAGEAKPFYEQKQEAMSAYKAPKLDLGEAAGQQRPVRGLVRTMMSPIASYVRDNAVLGAGEGEDETSAITTSGAPVATGGAAMVSADGGAASVAASERASSNGHRAEAPAEAAGGKGGAKPASAKPAKVAAGATAAASTKKAEPPKSPAKSAGSKASASKAAASKPSAKKAATKTEPAKKSAPAKSAAKPAAKKAAAKAAPAKSATSKAAPAKASKPAKSGGATKSAVKAKPAPKASATKSAAAAKAKKAAPKAKPAAAKKRPGQVGKKPAKPAPKKAAAKAPAKKAAPAKKTASKAKPAAKSGKSAKSAGGRASRR